MYMFAKLPQEQRKEKISIFSQQFQNAFFRFQIKRPYRMTSSFKGNNSLYFDSLFFLPPFLQPLSLCIFNLSLPTRISRDSHPGPLPFSFLKSCPTSPHQQHFPLLGLGSRNQVLLLPGLHSSLFRTLLPGRLVSGGTGFTLPSWLCLLPGVQRRFNDLTADLLQLISAFSWTEQPGSRKALQNGN